MAMSLVRLAARPKLRSFLFILLGVSIFIILLHFGSRDLLENIIRPDPLWLILTVVGLAATLFIFAYRLKIIAGSLSPGSRLSPWRLYFYNVSSLAAAIFVPQTLGIFVVRATALTQLGGIPSQKSIFAVLFDKLFDALIMLVFAAPGLLLVVNLLTLEQALLGSAGEIILIFAILLWRYALILNLMQTLLRGGITFLRRVPLLKRLGRVQVFQQAQNFQEWDLVQQKTILAAFGLTVVGQVGLILRSWFIAHAIGLEVSLGAVCIGVALSQLMQLIAFTPGALGFVEAAWYVVFASAGVTGEQILAFVVAHRVFENLAVALTWVILYFPIVIVSRFSPTTVASNGQNQP